MLLQNSPMNPAQLIPMLILWIIFSVLGILLLIKRKVQKKYLLTISIALLVICGIILGAVPNPILPIQQILHSIKISAQIQLFLSFIIMLVLLLLMGLFFGRLFCGSACPLGALQELMSKFRFKSEYSKKNPKVLNLSKKTTKIIQYTFFIVYAVLGIIWGSALIQALNPFLGFQIFPIFRTPMLPVIIIPLILLVVISIASIFFYRPWCRLFCPFGTLVSITARFSMFKLRRTEDCDDCKLCEKICPTQEAFKDSTKDECYLCGRCIEICPKDAIVFSKDKPKS
ncbi:MAG: 4Fe-4S binding protein [Promethearchaeota archaeon]